jgi:hypothetical protein
MGREMNILRFVIRGYLYLRYACNRIAGKGIFGRNAAVNLESPPLFSANPIKKALFRHYVRQFHESSCSVASVATVINAVLDLRSSGHVPITQHNLLNVVHTGNWKKRMSPTGDNGKRGLPLPLLGEVVKDALNVYGIRGTVEMVQAPAAEIPARAVRKNLLSRLQRFETVGDCILIAHFDQGTYVPALHIPHISPVGGFDPDTRKVTLLDVDPSQKGPYSVDFNTFYRGLSENFHHVFSPFGYTEGGYIFISLDDKGHKDS